MLELGAHSREIIQSDAFIGVPVFRSHRGQPLCSGKLGESIVQLGRIVGFEHNSTAYTLRRGYANMLNVKACAEDRKSLMDHKTNSEIYSHYHSAISSVHVQELFQDIRVVEHAEMHSLSLNRMQQLPQTISPEGWEQVQQDPEFMQFALEASQLSAALCEVYESNAAAARAYDPRVPDLLAATSRLNTRRRALLRHVYQEEYRAHFVERAQLYVSPLCTSTAVVSPLSDPLPMNSVYASDAQDWVQHVEQEEQRSAEELSGYENIIAEDARSPELRIEALDSGSTMTDKHVRAQLPEESCKTRLHKINNGSARPKNMSITRVREAMSSGGLTDADLSQIMVEVFSATHRAGKYLLGEEPLLGTSSCRFSGVDLSSDTHAPDTAHRAHFTMRQKAAAELFVKHLAPLDTPCSYYSQGPTQKKNPRLCGFRSRTRMQQIKHAFEHTLKSNRLGHEAGHFPPGEWHCCQRDCAVLTTTPSTRKGTVPKVQLSTTSIFLSQRAFLKLVYQEHHVSPLAIESVVWCGICENFLDWNQFSASTDNHFAMHWEEVWQLVADHGYVGQADNGHRTIPSFCPFCLHNEDLSPLQRIPPAMNFYDRNSYAQHIAMHIDGLDPLPHGCPCFPKTCPHVGKMTTIELADHLDNVHGIRRARLSRAERSKKRGVFSERPVNMQGPPPKKLRKGLAKGLHAYAGRSYNLVGVTNVKTGVHSFNAALIFRILALSFNYCLASLPHTMYKLFNSLMANCIPSFLNGLP